MSLLTAPRGLFRVMKFIWKHPLNRRAPAAAVGRFVKWQLASRLLNQPTYLPFVNDTVLVVERGMTGASGNWYCGLHEYPEMTFLLRFLQKDDVFVDVGANVGSYTVLAAGVVGAKTIAFEPIPLSFRRLSRNVEANDIAELAELHCVGVSDKPGALHFTDDLDTVNHVSAAGESGSVVEVPVTTLDLALGDRRPSLMKMDIEGHEFAALQGATETLRRASLLAVILETNQSGARYGVPDSAVLELMRGFDFYPHRYDPEANQLELVDTGGLNTIFIRDLDGVMGRLRSSQQFTLCNGIV
jgi:FkbM family methyltransferase